VTAKEVVDNGSFEEGGNAWYLEGGARVAGIDAQSGHYALILPATGAYVDQTVTVVPGARYRLSAWAMLGATGDAAEIGVQFIDADGEQLTDREPGTLMVTESDYTRLTLVFTVPDGVTEVRIAIWKPSGGGILAVDGVSLRGIDPGSGE
jgi:hypothetical protein